MKFYLADYELENGKGTFWFDTAHPFAVEVWYEFHDDYVDNGWGRDDWCLELEWDYDDWWLMNPETGDRMESNLIDAKDLLKEFRGLINKEIEAVLDNETSDEMERRIEQAKDDAAEAAYDAAMDKADWDARI